MMGNVLLLIAETHYLIRLNVQ